MPKPKKPGRPKLPEGNAKGVMLRVRITPEEQTCLEKAAKASNEKVSIRLVFRSSARMPSASPDRGACDVWIWGWNCVANRTRSRGNQHKTRSWWRRPLEYLLQNHHPY
jgi:hypothetical protein